MAEENTETNDKELNPEPTSLMKVSPEQGKAFMEVVKQKHIEKYASDVARLIEDRDHLQKALTTLNKWLAAIESGNFEYIKIYNKKRSILAEIEDGTFE